MPPFFTLSRAAQLSRQASLSIPTPYAFNYHLDQSGQFRGLAFANFRQSADADAVVAALNGFDVQGRKLRVEYKKVLQAGEKERIEREKALRRMRSMQLEKEQQAMQQTPQYDDFGPVIAPPFTPSRSFSGTSPFTPVQQYSPPPIPQIPQLPTPGPYNLSTSPLPPTTPGGLKSPSNELDLNDPSTLEIYSRILLFKDDHMRDELAFSRTLTAKQRRVVHLVAQKLGVYHYSVGEGEERYAVVTRIDPSAVSVNLAALLTTRANLVAATTATKRRHSSNSFPRAVFLPFRWCSGELPAHEEVDARHEDSAVAGAPLGNSRFEWQYPRRLRHHCLPFSALPRRVCSAIRK